MEDKPEPAGWVGSDPSKPTIPEPERKPDPPEPPKDKGEKK